MESDLVSASSGGSMSDYASDTEDVEVELSRDKTRTRQDSIIYRISVAKKQCKPGMHSIHVYNDVFLSFSFILAKLLVYTCI